MNVLPCSLANCNINHIHWLLLLVEILLLRAQGLKGAGVVIVFNSVQVAGGVNLSLSLFVLFVGLGLAFQSLVYFMNVKW